jgi:hypothetical protein
MNKPIIANNGEEKKELFSSIDDFFASNRIGEIMQSNNFYKEKGICPTKILKFVFSLIFTGLNLNQTINLQKEKLFFKKDVVYRFLNSVYFNWRNFLQLLATTLIKKSIQPLTMDSRVNVLVIDDSLYSRSRSKVVELLANVYDHVHHKFVKGFRMLTLAWSDGNTLIPLDFALLSSENTKNIINPIKKGIDKRTNGYKRRREAVMKATDVIIEMLDRVKKYSLNAKYVLFDSWFTYPSILLKIKELEYDIIAMVKKMPKLFYSYQGQYMNITKIYSLLKKNRGKAEIKGSCIVEIGKDSKGEGIKGKLVFVKNRNKKREWLCLISTDINLSEEEIIRIYGKRWDIEVFFKICKSFLKLANEFHGQYYDSLIAHTTIIFARYIMLAMLERENKDARTIGELFYLCCGELDDINVAASLKIILDILKEELQKKLFLIKETISDFINQFISRLPIFIKAGLKETFCES